MVDWLELYGAESHEFEPQFENIATETLSLLTQKLRVLFLNQ